MITVVGEKARRVRKVKRKTRTPYANFNGDPSHNGTPYLLTEDASVTLRYSRAPTWRCIGDATEATVARQATAPYGDRQRASSRLRDTGMTSTLKPCGPSGSSYPIIAFLSCSFKQFLFTFSPLRCRDHVWANSITTTFKDPRPSTISHSVFR